MTAYKLAEHTACVHSSHSIQYTDTLWLLKEVLMSYFHVFWFLYFSENGKGIVCITFWSEFAIRLPTLPEEQKAQQAMLVNLSLK